MATALLAHKSGTQAAHRLTALWAFSEAGLGGVLHAFNLPFTALSVGGIAVVLITLIASYSQRPFHAILRATLIVILLKAAISPHSPVMAYVAVGFQGVLGAVIFSTIPWLPVGAVLLGTLAMLESALQKLLTLTIIYGAPLWEAIDMFFHYAGQKMGIETTGMSLSYGLIVGYTGLYAMAGVVIGWLAGRMVSTIHQLPDAPSHMLQGAMAPVVLPQKHRPWYRHPLFRYSVLLFAIVGIMLLLGNTGHPWEKGLYIVLRSVLVLVLWLAVVAPILHKILQQVLQRERHKVAGEVNDAMALLPVLRKAIPIIWQQQQHRGAGRIWYFLVDSIHFVLTYRPPAQEEVAAGSRENAAITPDR